MKSIPLTRLIVFTLLILAVSVAAIPTGYSSKYTPPPFLGFIRELGASVWSTMATGMTFEKTLMDTQASIEGKVPTPAPSENPLLKAPTNSLPAAEKAPQTKTSDWETGTSSTGPGVSSNAGVPCTEGTTTCGVGACKRTIQNCVNGIQQKCLPGIPHPEICGNGIDDNCNGHTDENCPPPCTPNWVWSSWSACASGLQTRTATDSNNCPVAAGKPADQTQPCQSNCTPVTLPCEAGIGACTRTGTQTQSCVNGVLGAPSICSATAGIPAPEICGNNIDDNCNGQADEGCGNPTGHYCSSWSDCASQNCVNNFCGDYQGCINACTTMAQNCQTVCSNPFSCTQQCNSYPSVNQGCAMACHQQAQPCTPVTQPCTVGAGACARTGTQTQSCFNGILGAPSACSATPGNPSPEICGNSIDDNCDGQVDEGCLKLNGQLCSQGSDCQSQNCVFYQSMGICKSYQDCINGCTYQNCQQVCNPFCTQQCTTMTNGACAQNCHT